MLFIKPYFGQINLSTGSVVKCWFGVLQVFSFSPLTPPSTPNYLCTIS